MSLKDQQIAQARRILGDECRCCGEVFDLQFDHIVPVIHSRGTRKHTAQAAARAVIRGSIGYQLLCSPCNGWKSNGPRCPCPMWDRYTPGWRATI